MHDMLASLRVHTVCQEAACPNRWECFGAGTATFMILGTTCTRACRFCAVTHGAPVPPDADEPRRIADAAQRLQLAYVVITSVTRDDLPDGGAGHFATTIRAVCEALPDTGVEVLTPDFQGDVRALETVLAAQPAVFNHNIETVERLTPALRNKASYLRSLAVLGYAHRRAPELAIKSGLMAGVGETSEEIRATLGDLRSAGCSIVTIGQYLAPSAKHAPVQRYVSEEEFAEYSRWAHELGFAGVAAGALVRSSYHAARLTLPQKESRISVK